jgi:hypothetical protein
VARARDRGQDGVEHLVLRGVRRDRLDARRGERREGRVDDGDHVPVAEDPDTRSARTARQGSSPRGRSAEIASAGRAVASGAGTPGATSEATSGTSSGSGERWPSCQACESGPAHAARAASVARADEDR